MSGTDRNDAPVRIAYLILAHDRPEQFLRLVQALPAASPLFVHIDRRVPADRFAAFRAVLETRPDAVFVRRHAGRWGDIGVVRGTLSLMEAAVGSGVAFDYATLLSGVDYPIKSDARIARTLADRRGAEFIEAVRMNDPASPSQQNGLYRWPDKVLRFHLRIRSRVYAMPWLRRLPGGLEPYAGSQWWTLSRDALAYVAANPLARRVLRFMRFSYIPDESFVQTLIANSPFGARMTQDSLRLYIWDRPEPPYPATLYARDIDLLRDSPKLFARKFDLAAEPALFDLIDRTLRGDQAEPAG